MFHLMILLAIVPSGVTQELTTQQVVERLVRADNQRLAALTGYTGLRRYHFENTRFGKRADVTVRVACDASGAKAFTVLSESGSGFVRNRIIYKMIDAEREASRRTEKEQTRIIPENYDFRMVGTEAVNDRRAYILELSPKTNNRFLIKGRVWIDAEDFAIVRIEGQPAKNPSFWIRSVQVVQRYGQTGMFWLPVVNQSSADARVFGHTELQIEYFDYVTNPPNVHEATVRVKDSGGQ